MQVVHNTGRFWPVWWVWIQFKLIFYWIKLTSIKQGFKPFIEVEYEFFFNSIYYSDDQGDYLKTIGSKSGFFTSKNHEEIASFKFSTKTMKFVTCRYINHPDTNGKKNMEFLNEETGDKTTQLIHLKYWVPVGPYAGGDFPPKKGFKYKVKIRKVKMAKGGNLPPKIINKYKLAG